MVFNSRNVLAFFVAWGLILSGSVRRATKKALQGEYILSIYFHDPDKDLFESCIKWLKKRGFFFLTTQDLMAVARGEIPFPKGAVVITADDGWKDNKENIATVAEQYGIPVTIFVSTEPVESGKRYWWSYISKANHAGLLKQSVEALKMVSNEERLRIVAEVVDKIPLEREALTISEVQQLSNSGFVSIGSHTVTHPILPTCTDETVFFELSQSKKILESWLHKEVNGFAFPNGSFTGREVDVLRATGYDIAFTTQTHYLTKQHITDLYRLPRFEVFETASFAENICRMSGVWFNKPLSNQKS